MFRTFFLHHRRHIRETLVDIEQPIKKYSIQTLRLNENPCAIVGDIMRDIGYFKNFQRWMDRDHPSQLSDTRFDWNIPDKIAAKEHFI